MYELNMTRLAAFTSICLNKRMHCQTIYKFASAKIMRLVKPDIPKTYGKKPIGIKITEYKTD